MDAERPEVDLREAQGTLVGDGGLQVNLFTGAVRAGLRAGSYLEQVRRVAPPRLAGRDGELAELERFCLAPASPSYAWWQAGPWAGKSALLSTFVLDPPPGVRVVSFFITARLAAQDTREAFTEVLLGQLAGLLGQSLPAVLPEATREAYLLGLLSDAAAACEQEGGRLVLVVDGLDEDQGMSTGPGAHSIAGLLPAQPPAGMRVVVAGRPDPPVPDDVPDWHPLRDPAIVRVLAASPHAGDVRRLGRQELQRLLHGSDAERDLLGLLTAARGGLSALDLADLAGIPLWEAERVLLTSAGRTFTCRPSSTSPASMPGVYLLGHEELWAAAADYFQGRLGEYQARLHGWADGWRDRGWPEGTPEYLLGGYFRLLDDLGELPRMAELAKDADRHDLMFGLTGGDAAALAETRAALDHIAAQDDPDLKAALALARHRDHLIDRNSHIPCRLPAVWATLGQHHRAEALALSIARNDPKGEALCEVASALARDGLDQRAMTLACSIASNSVKASVFGAILRELARAGHHERAEAVARSIADKDIRERAQDEAGRDVPTEELINFRQRHDLAQIAKLARAGQYEDAEVLARSSSGPHEQSQAMAEIARALARAGQHEDRERIAIRAEALARSIVSSDTHAHDLAVIAWALARAGQHEQADALARSINDSAQQAWALAHVAGRLAWAGQHERAEALARSINDRSQQGWALGEVSGVLARAGRHERAEDLARSINDSDRQEQALAKVAGALARAGQLEQAEALAPTNIVARALHLCAIAEALARSGQREKTEAIVTRVLDLARKIGEYRDGSGADFVSEPLTQAAEALALAGLNQKAGTVARMSRWEEEALSRVAGALAEAGQYQQAEALARSIDRQDDQAFGLARIAEALARAGKTGSAIRMAAATCALGPWTTAVGPVLLVAPSCHEATPHIT